MKNRPTYSMMNNTPDNLHEALEASGDLACFAMMVNDVASIIMKATEKDLHLWHGERPVGLRPILYKSGHGAVIALEVTIYELGGDRFNADTVLNVASEFDLALLRKLAKQREYHIHFFNGGNEYVFSKSMPYRSKPRAELVGLIDQALAYNQMVNEIDFPLAKRDYFEVTADKYR